MAPRKRSASQEEPAKATTESVRVTRSSTRRVANPNSADSFPNESVKPELPKKKKVKVAETKKKEKVKEERKMEEETLEMADGDAAHRTIIVEHWLLFGIDERVSLKLFARIKVVDDDFNCIFTKQCNSFKTRALQVEKGLLKGVPNVKVELNPDKPRRGCFEIREKDGEIFISLLDMKRPFKPMKDLDMEEVIADIINKITG
ncbi:hypothetical protein FEM48_Zijuj06G0102700 [Ziziphus jujuba var. spinosa]|uniref:Selenoprotein H-like n=1 Tax=Ziziphus jujuba var. spinosa TaxID=714518 RepID=A0A978V8P6_ZIZJJ|nr:hypothetical protein FEM48_Zijuj06G0102700 [Ziziphus jujuba var. spinosa]